MSGPGQVKSPEDVVDVSTLSDLMDSGLREETAYKVSGTKQISIS